MKLGVNVDHVATLRQARHTAYPDPLEASRLCAEAGATGITMHLREDRRHIQDSDIYLFKKADILPLNLEMANVPEIVKTALDVRPAEACLVPERRQELTTEGGLDVVNHFDLLKATAQAMKQAGICVSLFIEADAKQIEASAKTGAPYIELHTGSFCDAEGKKADKELDRLMAGARLAYQLGLKVNAGHGINLSNIQRILDIPYLDTLNIGHGIVSRAVLVGMKEAVREMLEAMSSYRGGAE